MAFFNNPNATATVTVTEPIVITPGYDETVYSYGFEDYAATNVPASQVYFQNFETNTLDGWALVSTGKLVNTLWGGSPLSQGQRSLTVGGNNVNATPVFQRAFTGLTVGRSYTFTAIGCALAPAGAATTNATIGAVGIGATSSAVLNNTAITTLTYTFTATATSHTLQVSTWITGGNTGDMATWDNLTLTANAYTNVTNNGRDGFTGGTVQSVRKRTGNYALYGTTPARAFTGLTVGHQYTLRGWMYFTGTQQWVQVGAPVTAASTAQSFSLPAATNVYWDDVELVHHVPAVTTLTPVLKLSEGDVTLDSGRYPYAEAKVSVPFTGEDLLEQLETGQRVIINATEGETSAELNLGLRKREVSHDGKQISLDLATDEAALEAWADIVEDKGPRAFENNLRNLVQYVIGKAIPSAFLEPGTANADVTARWNAQNVITNPDAVNTGAPYTTAGNVTLSWSTAANVGQGGSTGYVVGTSAAAGQAFIAIPQNVSTRKGDMWNLSAYMHKSSAVTATVNGILRVYEMDSAGAVLRQIESTPKALIPSGSTTPYGWDRHDLTFTIQNPNTTKLAMYASMVATAGGQNFGVDSVQLTEGPVLLPYFSGSRTPAGYVTNWTGQSTPLVNNSVSERKPSDGIERLPDLFTWKAGVNAWDFLKPLVASTGLRLYCDIDRKWYLIDPATHAVPGRFSARPDNTVQGTDTIDADDEDTQITGVVVNFRWTDADGVSQERMDSAGVAGKVKVLDFDSPYPGPGIAAAHLLKLTGQNRTQDVTVRTDYTVRPGQEVQIDLPGTFAQIGSVTRVNWELTNGLMSIGSAGLRETPDGAIDLLTGTIDGLTGSIDSL